MNPSKAWAMLTARGVAFGGVGRGGVPLITAADISRMLQGLERGPFLMGMVMECGDVHSLGELERWLWIETMEIARRERWPFCHGQQYCRRMAGLALFEVLIPAPNECATCHGEGYVVMENNGVECEDCRNHGGKAMSAHMRSDLAGVPYTSWQEG